MIVKPLPPVDEGDRTAGKPYHDKAKAGFSIQALERLIADCDDQPRWRDLSDLCCAYYDGNQLTARQQEEAKKNNLVPRSTNLIQGVINGVLGQEERARRDPTLEPDSDTFADMCDYLNVQLKEAQRETYADMAIGNAYAGQVKAGIGWVEVSRVTDPMEYQYRVHDVHRDELWWDWRAKRVDLSDARWLVRRQWKDIDDVLAAYPEHAQTIQAAESNWQDWLIGDNLSDDAPIKTAYDSDRSFRINRSEWINGGRRRVQMFEVYYRVPAEIVVMRANAAMRWTPFNPKNPLHAAAAQRGLLKFQKTTTMQVRKAIFAGPFRLTDEPTTLRRFPYVPFFAFRTDAERTPYGLIHGMLSPQDEFNERRLRVQWMLKAQQLMIDADALDPAYNNITDIVNTMMRPDMVAVLNQNRRNANGMIFRNDFQLQKEQYEVMQDAKQLIQDVPRIYSTQLGEAPTGVKSGIAINSLVEQGLMAMGELNGNYAFARRLVYELLTQLIVEDHAEEQMQVAVGTGSNKRMIVLNGTDERGLPLNPVAEVPIKVGLGEVPSSPAYQMQMSTMMGQMIGNLSGSPMVAPLIPVWVENTSAFGPDRKQLADDMRRMAGLPASGDRQSAQEWQQQQQQAAAERAQLEKEAAQAKVNKEQAAATQAMSNAELNLAKVEEIKHGITASNDDVDVDAAIQESLREAAAT